MDNRFFSGNYSSLMKEVRNCLSSGSLLWFSNFGYYSRLNNEGLLRDGDFVVLLDRLGREKDFCVGKDRKMYGENIVLERARRADDVFAIRDVAALVERFKNY